jgi:hypothetical protein
MRTRDLKTGLLFQLCTFVMAFNGFSSHRVTVAGAKESALALATIALSTPFSVFHNQALLTAVKYPSVGISYRQPFSIKNYHETTLSVVCPIHMAVLSLGLSQAAVESYAESEIGISLAKKLAENLSVGVLFNYFDLNLPETGRHLGSFQVDGGVGFNVSEKLSLGLHLRNIVSTKAETVQNYLSFPRVARGGVACILTERILLLAETIYEKRAGCGFRCGAEIALLENFCLRGGLATNPFEHSFGFGYGWSYCQFDFSMVHHDMLGFTPMVSFHFKFD